MKCDMCGSEEKILYDTKIEGGRMEVCRNCSSYGEVVQKVRKTKKKKPAKKAEPEPSEPEKIKIIAEDYSKKLKKARESKELKQDEAAKALGEKTSVIRHLEHGEMKPSMELARKLEKFFGISLIQEYEDKKVELEKKDTGSMTIGDMISVK